MHAPVQEPQAQQLPPLLHGEGQPSDWVQRWTHLLKPAARALDLAAGRGRHTRWLQAQGHRVLALDRDAEALAAIDGLKLAGVQTLTADLEAGAWPLVDQRFDVVLVTNYLWRPLLPTLVQSLAPGGVLIYETFAVGNETVGKPSRPDFLLRPGELLQVCRGLHVVAFEDGYIPPPASERFVQRIVAVQPIESASPARYPLA
jgi:SAM-dependent methyltransferase